jgi:hypothetical protein
VEELSHLPTTLSAIFIRICLNRWPVPRPLHDAAWWSQKTEGFTLVKEDLNDHREQPRVWEGTMAGPYPTTRSGLNLRQNRAGLLKAAAIDPAERRRSAEPCERVRLTEAVCIHDQLRGPGFLRS